MATYRSMLELKIPLRRAALLTGCARTTIEDKRGWFMELV